MAQGKIMQNLMWKRAQPIRVDFHCRVIFTCVNTHVNFTRVNRIETRYEVLRLNIKLSEVQLLLLHFIRCLSVIYKRKLKA